MKKLITTIQILSILLVLVSCGKDNYDAPASQLRGYATYNGQPIGVRGSNQSVYLQLWQDGYPLKTPINVYLTQDGSFAAQLFDGTYKLVSTNGNGPWVSKQDTIIVQISGNTSMDYPVTPYYVLQNIQYQLDNDVLRASFDIIGVEESRGVEYVSLMVNDTKFVDFGQQTGRIENRDVDGNHIVLELNVGSQLQTSKALFARVGLKINGITEGIYDPNTVQIK
ncbi:DUF3823 domain-containing protein [Olivibacter sp. XZL3]|uniref:DUF3823 domain-containing protein n=1 Tax=Olivibacter sp. XZL3 TaxID=1735116 RepID=UPI0010650860|nr:DUF3823 domain-containing protein [Olivibacter sp. XZL3]